MEGSFLQHADFLAQLEAARAEKGKPFMRRGDVQKHNKPNDTFIVVNDIVYDVSSYLEDHPGGGHVFEDVAGQEATVHFLDQGHSLFAAKKLASFYIAETSPWHEPELDWRATAMEVVRDGLGAVAGGDEPSFVARRSDAVDALVDSALKYEHLREEDVRAALSSASSLNLSGALRSCCAHELKAIAQLLHMMPSLQSLNLDENAIGLEEMKTLSPALQQLPELRVLSLKGNKLGPCTTSRHRVSRSRSSVDSPAALLANALLKLPSLQSLNLASNDLGPTGARALLPAVETLHGLRTLDMSANDLDLDAAKILIPAIENMTELRVLRLKENPLDDLSAELLLDALCAAPQLRTLELEPCGVSFEDTVFFSRFAQQAAWDAYPEEQRALRWLAALKLHAAAGAGAAAASESAPP